MTSCWDPAPINRPSMEYVVEVMTMLCEHFPGADEPIVYNKSDDVDVCNDELRYFVLLPTRSNSNQSHLSPYQNYYEVDDVTINTGQSFYDSELDDRSETPTNNNTEPSTLVDEKQVLPSESLTRENINACIEEFSKMWAPVEKSRENDHLNNNTDKFDTIQTARSGSFRWTNFKRNGELRRPEENINSLTLQIDPNAWDLPTSSNPLTDENDSNCAISDAQSPLDTPRAASPIDSGDTPNIEMISTGIEWNDQDEEEDNQSTYDLMHLMLEPHLRPVSPQPNDQTSNQIFEEHKKLAKEYFKVEKSLDGISFSSRFQIILAIFSSDSNGNRLCDQTQRRTPCRHG